MRNRAFAVLLGFAVLGSLSLSTAGPIGREGPARAILAPLNPAYIRALASSRSRLPSPQNISHLRNQAPFSDETLPSSYDLRKYYRVTAVPNQIPIVTCTIFGIYSSLESTLKPFETLDFSENHLDASSEESDILEANVGALARWADPVDEEDDPWGALSPGAALPAVKHVQKVVFLAPRADAGDNDRIKQAVINLGAVYAEMYFDRNLINSTYNSYYNGSSGTGLQAVAIVGWEDDFAREKFDPQPPGDGAFLCKNSLGGNFGDAGYFYVSYHDASLGRIGLSAVFTAEPQAGLTQNYQYDLIGCTARLGFDSDTAWFANQFVSFSTDPLDAVSFYSYGATGAYEVFVYGNSGPGLPRSGILISQFAGTLDSPGYVTLRLPSPVPMAVNERFSVVVRLQNPGNNFPIPIEHPIPGFDAAFEAAPNQSFISPDGLGWDDLTTYEGTTYAHSNVCLKAFAGYPPIHPPAYLRVDRVVNNMVFYKEYIDRLTWLPNPFDTETIAAYRIYRKTKGEPNDTYEFLAEVGTSNLVYYVRGLQENSAYAYRVTTVTDSGREGDPAVAFD